MARKYKGRKLLGSLGPAGPTLDIDGAVLAAPSLTAPVLTGAATATGSLQSTESGA